VGCNKLASGWRAVPGPESSFGTHKWVFFFDADVINLCMGPVAAADEGKRHATSRRSRERKMARARAGGVETQMRGDGEPPGGDGTAGGERGELRKKIGGAMDTLLV